MSESDFVTVFHSQGMLQAQVIRGKLESAGVPVLLKYEAIGQVLGLLVDGLGLVEVQVPADWADTAEELLREDGEDGEGDPREVSDSAASDADAASGGTV